MSVGIKFCSKDERDPCVVGSEIKVRVCPNRETVDDRDRTETRAVASRIPIRAALEETSMLPRKIRSFASAAVTQDGSLWQKSGTPRDFVELELEHIPPSFFSFLSFQFRSVFPPYLSYSIDFCTMGFCRRCGDIVSGPKCKCGGTAVGRHFTSGRVMGRSTG